MGCLGNLLWFIFAGFWMMLGWGLTGLLWCLSIVGIPIGTQCFKIAGFAAMPFGRDVELGSGVGSLLLNVLWIVFGGIELTVTSAIIGCILCITIIGIPFGMQCFKLAGLALMPFGAKVY